MGTTEELSKFIVNTRYEDIPEEARRLSKRLALDWLGVALAGSTWDGGKMVTEYTREIGGTPEARVIGSSIMTSAANAAFANGTMGHLLDFDDTGFSHPTATIMPTLLAIGEKKNVSGKDALAALVIAYETFEHLSVSARPYERHLRRRGYHPTGVYGPMASVAAGARLMGLNVQQTRRAFGLAASQAAGLSQNFGTWGKGYHGGTTGRAAVAAVVLASKGYFADEEVIEGGHGLFHAIHGEGNYDIAKVSANLGNPWCIVTPGLTIKSYPCCGGNLRALDAALGIIREQKLKYEDIATLDVEASPDLLDTLRFRKPTIAFNGKFSLDYNMAAAIVFGKVDIDSFRQPVADDPRMREALEKKVRIIERPEGTGEGNPVTITTRDGRKFSKTVAQPKGHPKNPFSQDDLRAKFRYCAGQIPLPAAQVDKLINAVEDLESVKRVSEITELAVAPAGKR